VVRIKEQQVCSHGLPYVEVNDPFYTMSEMFPTDTLVDSTPKCNTVGETANVKLEFRSLFSPALSKYSGVGEKT